MVKPEDDFVDNDAMSIAAAAVNLDSEREGARKASVRQSGTTPHTRKIQVSAVGGFGAPVFRHTCLPANFSP
jgi:hypothetical protein